MCVCVCVCAHACVCVCAYMHVCVCVCVHACMWSLPTVASKVAGQQHTIAEESVQVRLCTPPKPRPTYPNKLLFLNLPDNVTENHLKTFLKLVTGCTPIELRYGDEESVLATFDKHQGNS